MISNKIAVVVGASGGMGLATVKRLAQDGFTIAALDLNTAAVEKLIREEGISAKAYALDASNEASCKEVVAQIEKDFGRVDVLVNLVGWTLTSKFLEEDSTYWTKLIGVNFLSAVYMTHAIAPMMIANGGGRIVYVTSDAAKVGQSGEAVYAGLKGGVVGFAKSVAREFARYNINVNCTAPGPTDTPLEHSQDPAIVERIIKKIPFRRWASPEEQASVIAFFASEDAKYITGQVLSVSGGLTMS
jgi:2-hydroxycyclohexanecarboxyl-CoA dehydrogenase